MTLPMSFRPLREKTSVMRSRYLFEIYMREGHEQMRKGHYRKAVESYDAALQLNGCHIAVYVAKSKCHLRLGFLKQAMADTEMALAIDNIFPPAVLQKADIFFTLANYEMALLFYHRGYKIDPGEAAFIEGIVNCQKHISDTRKRKAMKLTAAGDLTIYVHKKMAKDRHQPLGPISEVPSRRNSSAGRIRKKKFINPFVRLGRKQPIKLSISLRKTNQKADNKRKSVSRSSGGTVFSEPDEKTLKELLGELYGDSIYLKGVYRDTENEESRVGAEVHNLAESGLRFLLDRVTYWNYRRLPPAPTPSPPLSSKRSRQGSSPKRTFNESPLPRQKSSLWEREVSDLLRLLNTPREESVTEEHIIEGYRPYKKEKKKVKQLTFDFVTYRPGSDFDGRGREELDISEGTSDTGESIDELLEQEDYIMNYLQKELSVIEKAFEEEDFPECKTLALSCLQTVYSYSEEELADKLDLVARVHSLLGNVHMELENVEDAQEHHEMDLEIGEKCELNDAVSRSLGNLGRVFIQKKLFHKALGAFARKLKFIEREDEKAWLFHEIGDCFLCLNLYGYARAAGRKSLEAAEVDQHRMYQLQACVLIGVAQVKLLEYNAAYEEFERALDLAKIEGDKDSEEMIARALKEVNSLITERTRRLTEQSQEAKQPDNQDLLEDKGTDTETGGKEDMPIHNENEVSSQTPSQLHHPEGKELGTVLEESTEAETDLSGQSNSTSQDGNLDGGSSPTDVFGKHSEEEESVTTTSDGSDAHDAEISGNEGSTLSFRKQSEHGSNNEHPDKESLVVDEQKTTINVEEQSAIERAEGTIQTAYTEETIEQSLTRRVSESERSIGDELPGTTRSTENQTMTPRPGSSGTKSSTKSNSQILTEKKSETPDSHQTNIHVHHETPHNSGHLTPSLDDVTKFHTVDKLREDGSQGTLHRSGENLVTENEFKGDLIENAEKEAQDENVSPVKTNESVSSDEHMSVKKATQNSLEQRQLTSPIGSEGSRRSIDLARTPKFLPK